MPNQSSDQQLGINDDEQDIILEPSPLNLDLMDINLFDSSENDTTDDNLELPTSIPHFSNTCECAQKVIELGSKIQQLWEKLQSKNREIEEVNICIKELIQKWEKRIIDGYPDEDIEMSS
ncbi:hypothetical protein FQN57_003538 [Myotisia sp. PD_48]|nr:hypothetical protein FQN57_003538 [Myotisia sp. PD_48]